MAATASRTAQTATSWGSVGTSERTALPAPRMHSAITELPVCFAGIGDGPASGPMFGKFLDTPTHIGAASVAASPISLEFVALFAQGLGHARLEIHGRLAAGLVADLPAQLA